MKREDQTVIRHEQPIKNEKPLQFARRPLSPFLDSFVKEITLLFSKLKSWLKTQRKREEEDLQKLEKLLK